jgi:ATP-binding cassette, subfamily F, member 3
LAGANCGRWAGKITRASKLRIGYFAQHQVDELHADETPLAAHPAPAPG